MAVTNTKFYAKDPENQDTLDQEGLNGGEEAGSSYFWIYVLIGVLVLAGIIVLISCLSGKKKTDFGIPSSGELKPEEIQTFIKSFHDKTAANLPKLADLDAATINKITDTAAKQKKLDELEKEIEEQQALWDEANTIVEKRIKPDPSKEDPSKKEFKIEINGVKDARQACLDYMKIVKEATSAGQRLIDSIRKADKALKDPTNKSTDAPIKPVDEANDIYVKAKQAASDAEPEVKKLFPADKAPAQPNKPKTA